MNFYKNWTKEKIRRHTERMDQLSGIARMTLDDGCSQSLRCAKMRNGSGLQFDALPDRGMNIFGSSFKGIPLVFLTPPGFGRTDGKALEQENGTVRILKPGESVEHVVQIKIEGI